MTKAVHPHVTILLKGHHTATQGRNFSSDHGQNRFPLQSNVSVKLAWQSKRQGSRCQLLAPTGKQEGFLLTRRRVLPSLINSSAEDDQTSSSIGVTKKALCDWLVGECCSVDSLPGAQAPGSFFACDHGWRLPVERPQQ